jgi:hypothetical protein
VIDWEARAVEIWDSPGELRCVIRPRGDRWEVSVMREHADVKVDLFRDAAAALAAADAWRRSIDRSHNEGATAD